MRTGSGRRARHSAPGSPLSLLLLACAALLLCQCSSLPSPQRYRGLPPAHPESAQPSSTGLLYVNLPAPYTALLYQSPVVGGGQIVAEWKGGASMSALGSRFEDGQAAWLLVRDPLGNEGWMGELFLADHPPSEQPPAPEDAEYLAAVHWEGQIAYCVNPSGGPPGLDGEAFVALVERAATRWQEATGGVLPLDPRGHCETDPSTVGDGVSTVGWVADLGLVIAAQALPNADQGAVSEIDVRLSRGYFERLHARDAARTIEACALSTLVHEFGHVLGLDHPRSRAVPSSMQGVGASRCDKAQPSQADRANLLRRYAPPVRAP